MNGGLSFLSDERTLLGTGRRRRCDRMPGTDLCAKFYHAPHALPPGTRLTTRLNIAWGRRCRFANINYREWQYHQRLKRQLPDHMAAVFPEHTEPVHCPQRGWGIIETVILNADGTHPRKVADVLRSVDDPALGRSLVEAAERLFKLFVEHGVCFFDPSNILVQWTGPGTFRLRIADFEPSCRALIPCLSRIDFYVRCKVRRRATRYLRRLEAILDTAHRRHGRPFVRCPQRRSLFQRIGMAAGLMM
jgi:hypothetical protein